MPPGKGKGGGVEMVGVLFSCFRLAVGTRGRGEGGGKGRKKRWPGRGGIRGRDHLVYRVQERGGKKRGQYPTFFSLGRGDKKEKEKQTPGPVKGKPIPVSLNEEGGGKKGEHRLVDDSSIIPYLSPAGEGKGKRWPEKNV